MLPGGTAPRLATASRLGDPESVHGRCSIFGTVRRGERTTAARVEVRFLSEARPGRLAGRVTNASLGRMLEGPVPVAGARATARAEAEGRYVVDGLAPGIYPSHWALAEDGAQGSATATLLVDGARAEVNLALGQGAESLSGRVTHVDGRPFAGTVLVDAAPRDHSPWSLSLGTPIPVDASGASSRAGLERGRVVVTAIERGVLLATSRPVSIPRANEFVLVVDAGTTLRTGRVVADEDGTPVAKASVLAGTQSEDGDVLLAQTTTDVDGRFELRLANDRGGLRALAAGFAPSRTSLSDLPLGTEPIEIRLARGARLAGRVTAAADGAPVAGVSVQVIPEGRSSSYFPPGPATTDADGRYVVADLGAGEAVVSRRGRWLRHERSCGHREPTIHASLRHAETG